MMKRVMALVLTVAMTVSMTGCGSSQQSSSVSKRISSGKSESSSESDDTLDTITVMVPPITNDYSDKIQEWSKEFTEEYPNLKLDIINTSWDDHMTKLSTMAQAGEAPDIAELSYTAIGTYVENGIAINILDYMDEDKFGEYDKNALDYMTLDDGVYGLPLYITIQALGANEQMLASAGADVSKIQNEGWTYDEFMDVVKKGTKGSTFGFVFADAGVTASDLIKIFGAGAGMSNAFGSDLKYEYTSTNMLKLLQTVEKMIKSGCMPDYGIEASQRMVMCQTGNAMIFGKAMPLFENNINKNNDAIDAGDGTAVKNSIKLKYAFLPAPHMDGVNESCMGSVDGMVAFKNNKSTDKHIKNVMKALYFLSSGERAAYVDSTVCLQGVCSTSRDALTDMNTTTLDADNVKCANRLISEVIAPPTDITAQQSANSQQIMDEVIVPKFQDLLAGKCTAQEMYDDICQHAKNSFGAENCDLK